MAFSVAREAAATPGDRDSSFGKHGQVEPLPVGSSFRDVEFDDEGRVLAVAAVPVGEHWSRVLTLRFDRDGTPDNDFGTGGAAELGLSGSPQAVTQQDDGKIVLLARANDKTIVVRYNSDGTLDARFGLDGFVDFRTPWGEDVLVQPDGKIVVVGSTAKRIPNPFDSNVSDIAVIRLLPNGLLDPLFGSAGQVVIDVDKWDGADAVALDGSGNIVLAGNALERIEYSRDGPYGASDVVVSRMNQLGVLDPGFGDGGVARIEVTGGLDYGYGLALQDDKPVVVGEGSERFFVMRVTADGTLDPSFGDKSGFTMPPYGLGRGEDVTVMPDGAILAVGEANLTGDYYSPQWDMVLTRYARNGSFDPTFGSDGHVHTDVYGDDDWGLSIAESGGRIAVGGHAWSGYRDNRGPLRKATLLGYLGEDGDLANADGDTLPDARDRCPAVAGPRRSRGCPRAPLAIDLRYRGLRWGDEPEFYGYLETRTWHERAACRRKAKVTLYEARQGADRPIARDRSGGYYADFRFEFAVTAVPGREYYAAVAKRVVPEGGVCLAARSTKVKGRGS